MSKQPIKFDKQCPRCSGVGEVARNNDYILWFECIWCGYKAPWRCIDRRQEDDRDEMVGYVA